MADIGQGSAGFLVSPTAEVEKKWIDVQIQEKISRIARWKQDIDDLQNGKILDLECRITMAEKEVLFLRGKRDSTNV